MMLESFALKQNNHSLRQQLSHALYKEDAATRVIARLIKERDAAREALTNMQTLMGGAGPSSAANGGADVDMAEQTDAAESAPGLPAEVVDKIDQMNQALSVTRKKRKAPAGHTTVAKMKTFTAQHSIPSLHAASPAGITALALSGTQPGVFVTGGNDKVVQVYDRGADKVLASLKGHTKKVHHVALRERDDAPTLVLSASADKTARVWAHDEASGEYAPRHTVKMHKGEVTGLFVHPVNTLMGLASADRTYSVHDLNVMGPIFQSAPGDDAYSSLAVHPDGSLIAVGTPSSTVQIFDIRTGALAASLTPENGTPFTVNTLSFSENGYHLLAPDSTSTVAIWDLRKQSRATTIDLGSDFKVNKVVYDISALYFGVAGNEGGRIYAHKTWDELLRLEEGGEMSSLAFGRLGKEVWGSTGREVRIWGLPQ